MDVAGTIHRHLRAIGGGAVAASEGGGPLMGTRRIEFRNKNVGAACGGDVVGPEINCVTEVAGDMDVAGTIYRHPFGVIAAGAAEGGGPLMDPRRIEFRNKNVVVARGGDVTGTKLNCPIEVSGDMDVAGTVHRHPKAKGVTGAAEGGGPLMDPRGVEFGDKHIDVARGGDNAGPKINCPAESSSGVHVAGTIHRHTPVGTVAKGAAERDRPIIRVVSSSRVPRRSRRLPPHNRQHAGNSQSQQGPEHSDNLEAKPKTTRDCQPKEGSRLPFRGCPTKRKISF